ncbi:MAG: carbohydrate kinase family protein [Halanaerobium sp.]
MENKVVVYGPVFADIIFSDLEDKPEPGKEVFSKDFLLTSGGLAITAVGLARLELNPELISVIGDDFFGDYIFDNLQSEGINLKNIEKVKNGATNITAAFVYNNDRGFITKMGSLADINKIHKKIISLFKQKKVSHFHSILEYDDRIMFLLKKAKANGIRTSLVTGWEGVKKHKENTEYLVTLFEVTDYFFCNLLEAKALTSLEKKEDILYKFNQWGVQAVITLGAEGAVAISRNGQICSVDSLEVDFLDPTGAGDSFAAGFIAALEKGYDIREALELGVYCGAKSTEKIGGTTAFPGWKEVESEMRRA